MRDARYLRAQAEFCLEMARQVSDRATSLNLRAEAARYHAEAAVLRVSVDLGNEIFVVPFASVLGKPHNGPQFPPSLA
jgi:hypothetical protein